MAKIIWKKKAEILLADHISYAFGFYLIKKSKKNRR